jgi:hypothetical protein
MAPLAARLIGVAIVNVSIGLIWDRDREAAVEE